MAPAKKAQDKTLGKLSKMENKLPIPAPGESLTFQQTEDEIINLVERLHDLRLTSNPAIFECLWVAHIGRVEELEAPVESVEPYEITPIGHKFDEEGNPLSTTAGEASGKQVEKDTLMEDEAATSGSNSGSTSMPAAPHGQQIVLETDAAAYPFSSNLLSAEDIRKRVYPNYSAEPFNSSGNPIPPTMTVMHHVPAAHPKAMSIYIMTSPPRVPYINRAYHHPAAPVREHNMVAFFTQVMERAEHLADKDVKGYAFSYGWCDITRWIEKTVGEGWGGLGTGERAGESEGEKQGWELFQKDLIDAAKAGVMIWRMKVLVVKK
jgi:hypothetical protein